MPPCAPNAAALTACIACAPPAACAGDGGGVPGGVAASKGDGAYDDPRADDEGPVVARALRAASGKRAPCSSSLAQIPRPASSKISWHWTTTDSSLTSEILTAAEGANWQPGRPPFLLETGQPGVFGAGDVRSGSVKRVTTAAGEGSMAVRLVHDHLEDLGAPLSEWRCVT
jgi:hypothetical protein